MACRAVETRSVCIASIGFREAARQLVCALEVDAKGLIVTTAKWGMPSGSRLLWPPAAADLNPNDDRLDSKMLATIMTAQGLYAEPGQFVLTYELPEGPTSQ